MQQPATVAAAVSAMRAACSLPVTVKHRIGVDDADGYDDLKRFVATVASPSPSAHWGAQKLFLGPKSYPAQIH